MKSEKKGEKKGEMKNHQQEKLRRKMLMEVTKKNKVADLREKIV